MVKQNFKVVGKQVIHSQKGNFYAVHLVVALSDREKQDGVGYKAITTMVEESLYPSIQVGEYKGYISSSGRYTDVSFEEFIS